MIAVEVVLFDFGGTLDADGVHWGPRFHAAYRAAGGALDYPAFDPLFKQSDLALARLPGIRALGFRKTIAAQGSLLLERLPDATKVDAARMCDGFHRETLVIIGRNRPTLERLARRYRLGVVSNFTGNLMPCLEELGLLKLFAVATDSGVLGAAKPDRRIFVETLSVLGAAPERVWMVGDNFETDIRPAAQLGMGTCWVTPPDRRVPPGCVPRARISRLPELEGILV